MKMIGKGKRDKIKTNAPTLKDYLLFNILMVITEKREVTLVKIYLFKNDNYVV